MQSGIKLESDRGDLGLAGVRYVFRYGTNQLVQPMLTGGLIYQEGVAAVSTDLSEVRQPTTGEPASLLLIEVPTGAQLGYAVYTDAVIDRAAKQVTGAPLRYAAGRQQLAFYSAVAWPQRRTELEQLLESSPAAAQPQQYRLPAANNLGVLGVSPGVQTVVDEIVAAVIDLSTVRTTEIVQYLSTEIQPARALYPEALATILESFIEGTVVSLVMQRLRMMRWEGLAGQGYRFMQDDQEITGVRAVPVAEQLAAVHQYEQQVAGSILLAGNLSWLKAYAHRALEVMQVEVTGA